ncbi:hypothetical protein BKH41_04010 [Helicobacter sp. 12S02232-10]|uniref:DMT family transporter n=1 Tax=Helicobacter sp. 12S02232-10 TaxID=1476197 RepID=UPI000BD4A988|nr:DMT family transporter [Helicobacter sp. 12S02232-10]PAF49252.1 hypothetical protein BKH41_04010 [Helicobacter sp. 12S02232-10]
MRNKELFFSFLLLLAMMSWGLSWPLSKIMVTYLSPYEITSIRYALVAFSLIPIMMFLRIPFKPPKKSLGPILIVSIFNALYTPVFYLGLTFGNAGIAGVIVTTLAPILASIMGVFIYHNTLSMREKIGFFLGVVSGAFLMKADSFSSLFTPFNIIFLVAALLWACVNLSSKTATSHINAIALNFYSSIFSFVVFLPSFFIFGLPNPQSLDKNFWICMVVVALFSTTFATTIFYKGISVLGINKGGSFMLLVPIFAVLLSWISLGEIPDLSTIIGGIIAITGICLINLFKPICFKTK